MAFDKVWVLAEVAEGKATSSTLELLTKARELGSTVEAWTWGGEGSSVAATLGAYGATKVYDVGDLSGALPAVPVASAMAAEIDGGNRPDAVLAATSYDGRDVAGRLSAK